MYKNKDIGGKANIQKYKYLMWPFLEKTGPGRDKVEWHEHMGTRWDLVHTSPAISVFTRPFTVLQEYVHICDPV